MFLQILGRTYKIGRAGREFAGTPQAAWLDVSAKLPAVWPGSAARLAGRSGLPSWLDRFRCTVGFLGSANLHVGSVRIPLCLARIYQHTSRLETASRLARLTACVAFLC